MGFPDVPSECGIGLGSDWDFDLIKAVSADDSSWLGHDATDAKSAGRLIQGVQVSHGIPLVT